MTRHWWHGPMSFAFAFGLFLAAKHLIGFVEPLALLWAAAFYTEMRRGKR